MKDSHTHMYTWRTGTHMHMRRTAHTCACGGQPHTCVHAKNRHTCVYAQRKAHTSVHTKDRHTHVYTLSRLLSCEASALAHCRRAHLDGPVLTIHSWLLQQTFVLPDPKDEQALLE